MRRVVALVCVLFVCLACRPAFADSDPPVVTRAHWEAFRWNNKVLANWRALYVFDRTGDANYGRALKEFVTGWNADGERRGLAYQLPTFAYVTDSGYVGRCEGFQAFVGFSFTTVCKGDKAGVGRKSDAGHV